MYRIDSSGSVGTLPTPAVLGTEGYWSFGNPGVPSPATLIDQDWLNAVQESLIALMTQTAIAHSKSDYTQLYQAILALAVMTDTGVANAMLVTPPVPLPAAANIALNTVIEVIPAHSNSGATTLVVSGGAATPVTDPFGNALPAQAIQAGYPIRLLKKATAWWLIGHPANVGFNAQVFNAVGTTQWIVPAPNIEFEGWAGGGGGGSSGTIGGTGGGPGGYFWGFGYGLTVGSTLAMTVGAAGIGGTTTPTNGTNGGSTSVGALMSATGGGGGLSGGNGLGQPGTATGGLLNLAGFQGDYNILTGTANVYLGGEGGSAFKSPNTGYATGTGHAAVFPGSGGGAGGYNPTSGTAPGGNGAAGMIIARW
jgi:hypothetical protein